MHKMPVGQGEANILTVLLQHADFDLNTALVRSTHELRLL